MLMAVLSADLPGENGLSTIQLIREALILFGLPAAIVIGTYVAYSRMLSWRARTWTIYIGWAAVAWVISFTFSATLGGMSMATVEGVSGGVVARYSRYAISAAMMTLFAQVFIVPWTWFSAWLLRRGEAKGH